MSELFVVSDLHMGDGGPRDNFAVGDRERQFLAFLDFVEEQRGELLILGDLFEFWQANLSKVLTTRLNVLDRLAELGAGYVLGNHDVDLKAFIGTSLLRHAFFGHMSTPSIRTIGGRKFKFMHGHEPDPFNKSDDPSTGRMLAILAGIVEEWNGSPMLESHKSIEEVLERTGESILSVLSVAATGLKQQLGMAQPPDFGRGLTPTQSRTRLDEHIGHIRSDLEANGYDVAVVGHTHHAGQHADWYFNSGSWTGASNDFLRINEAGEVTYFDWQQGRAQPGSLPIAFEGRLGNAKVA